MIPAVRSSIEFDRKFDRFVGQDKDRLRLEDKFAVINEGQDVLLQNMVRLAETNSKFRDYLRVLENKEVELELLEETENYSVFKIPDNNYQILRQRVIATKEGCGTKEIPVILFQTDDLNNARNSPFWKSSFQWEHLLGDEGAKGLYVWHEGDCKIDKLLIDYYRVPGEIHGPTLSKTGSYVDWNGVTQTEDSGCEFNVYVHRMLMNIAILISRSTLGDSGDFQIKLSEIFNEEKINT